MRKLIFLLAGIGFSLWGNGQDGTYTDPRDGEVYRTVHIGEQTWMAENLRHETDESVELRVKGNKYQTNFKGGFKGAPECGTTGEYGTKWITCEHLEKAGRYYKWEDATTACPPGWHLPTIEEWDVLIDHVNQQIGPVSPKHSSDGSISLQEIGKALKSKEWRSDHDNTDAYGFAANPDGYAAYDKIKNLGIKAMFWTSSPYFYKNGKQSNGYYWFIDLSQMSTNISKQQGQDKGRSVRCLKDI
jgi:uncharacterized protein (TIGR02145 family)